MQNLEFVLNSNLPSLAWHLEVRRGATKIQVIHGSAVETAPQAFFEGAWAGDFESMDFMKHERFGSGAFVAGNTIAIAAPDHTLSGIFVYKSHAQISASNSLPFILAKNGLHLSDDMINGQMYLSKINNGLSLNPIEMPLENGEKIEIYFWQTIEISEDLRVSHMNHFIDANLSDFQSYHDHLLNVIRRIFNNASDARRKTQYKPLSTISRGYDSATIAALAQKAGCVDAVTFTKSREKRGEAFSDSGEDIGKHLGLNVIALDRLDYLKYDSMPELETLGLGSEILSLKCCVGARILLVGYMGDTMWDRSIPPLGDDFKWSLPAGHDFTDFRLNHDFILLPVAFICAHQLAAINRISKSEEMMPWTLGNTYDRPICRRILEEMGVPRASFGQRKMAAGVFSRVEGLEKTLTPSTLRNYKEYQSKARRNISGQTNFLNNLKFQIGSLSKRISKKVFSVSSQFGMGIKTPIFFSKVVPISDTSFAFVWATKELSNRFRNALEENK